MLPLFSEEDAVLDRPDFRGLARCDQVLEQALADALAARRLGDVDAVLDHAPVDEPV
jgi:hypothetical protein